MKRYSTIFLVAFTIACLAAQTPIEKADYQKLGQVLFLLNNEYVDTVNGPQLIDHALVHVLEEFDPHSVYIPADEVKQATDAIYGSFDGIGIQYQMLHDTLLVVQTIAGCPAEMVGIVMGDKIVEVDGTNIAGTKKSHTDIMKLLRGLKGSKVAVKVMRCGDPSLLDFVITRGKIPIHSLDVAYMIAPATGYIKLNCFALNTMDEVHKALKPLQKQGMKQLVIDLQGNGGGIMPAAVDLADEFLTANQLIVSTRGYHQPLYTAKSTAKGSLKDIDVVVLVDEYSASASEILAGALQDCDRGIIVGRRTFGKGLVQRQYPLVDGSAVRITVARYYTPCGRNIQKPYGGGNEKYHRELAERLSHGELQHADSINFPDSLKFKTLHLGRTVYGGGGIMPDVFVPLDTTYYTTYHRRLLAKGTINNTVMEYLEHNRTALLKQYANFEAFEKYYQVPQPLQQKLIDNGEKVGTKYDAVQWHKAQQFIMLQMKAIMANALYTTGDYFKIMNTQDPVLKRGLEVLKHYKDFLK